MLTDLDPGAGPFAALLAAMDCVAMELTAQGPVLVSAAPPWLEGLRSGQPDNEDITAVLPFLQVFFAEAEAFWDNGRASRYQSDFWTQTDANGQEVHLLAFAAIVDGRRLVVVRSANDLYEERQRWQQYAHQTTIQLRLIERLQARLEQSAVALQAANDRLSELSIRDSITGLYNRRHFDQSLEWELGHAMRTGEPLSVLFIDLDKFKVLNDTYGHSTGDDCLRAVASVLEESVSGSAATVARFGGEEFALLLPATNTDVAYEMALSINAAVFALGFPNKHSEVAPVVTASVGVYTRSPNGYRTMAQIMNAADAALYRAKREGRNRVCVAPAPGDKTNRS